MRTMRNSVSTLCLSLAVVFATATTEAQVPQSRDQKVTIVVSEMCCAGCARKVTGQLYAARGVKDVGVDLNARTVTVTLPERGGASLGQLWYAVEKGDGGPTQLSTPAANYSFAAVAAGGQPQVAVTTTYLVVDNLHCMACAQKIARQLYALRGVTKVSADLPKDTLIVESRPEVAISPWLVIDAVAKANERPLAITGSYGTLSVQWATRRAPKTDHQQAQQPAIGGIQR